MSEPSKCHQAAILHEMASLAIKKIGEAGSFGHRNRPPTIYSLVSKLDQSVLKWSLAELGHMGSDFRIFRDCYLDTEAASKLIGELTKAGSYITSELFQIHQDVFDELQADQKKPWIGDNIFTEPVVGSALDLLAMYIGDGRISVKTILNMEPVAAKIVGCDDLRDLVLRIDKPRITAVNNILAIIEPDCGHDEAWLNVTANPFFKRSSEQLEAIAKRRFEFSGQIDLLVVASAYLKAFEQTVGNILSASVLQALSGSPNTAPMLVSDQWSNDQVITTVKAKGKSLVYVIGTFDKRITIYNEQVRALRVARALIEERIARPGSRVVVIGGGVAGVTASIALAKRQCEVTLIEKNEKLIQLQESASHRYLHPHIFSWPSLGSTRGDAGLPYPLNWLAGTADNVSKRLRTTAESHTRSSNCLYTLCMTEMLSIKENDDCTVSLALQDRSSSKQKSQNFDIAIFAIGFGSDQYCEGEFRSPSYWTPDGLDDLNSGKVLISGTGDGGLIDVMRAAFHNFSHETMIEKLSQNELILKLGKEISAIDEQARAEEKRAKQYDLFDAYMSLDIKSETIALIDTKLCKRLSVTLVHQSYSPFSTTSAIINKVFVLILLRAKAIRLIRGNITKIEHEQSAPTSGWVTIEDQGGNQTREFYDRVIVRHGPKITAHFNTVAGEQLSDACAPLNGIIASLGITERLDIKTDEFFN